MEIIAFQKNEDDGRPVLVIPKCISIAEAEAIYGAWNMRIIHSEPLPLTYKIITVRDNHA